MRFMDSILSKHSERVTRLCKHTLHPSACTRTLWCPRCIITAAQADLERVGKKLEAEGGADAPAYMRDGAWNSARLRYAATKRRVKRTMRRDWQRQERERLWDEGHGWYVAQHGRIHSDPETCAPCVVCATMVEPNQRYAKPAVCLKTTWWERDVLIAKEMVVPRKPLPSTKRRRPPQPQAKQPSYLADFIRSRRFTRIVSDEDRRSWDDRCKLAGAIRRKYDLPDDYELDQELFANPLPATHARYHHRQTQNGEQAAKRRANRHKRRAEDYRPCRSSLAHSELTKDVDMDKAELERLRLEEDAAVLQRSVGRVAGQVGYMYFVGEMGLLDRWKDDYTRSDLDLVQRQTENGMYIGRDVCAEVGEDVVE